MKKLTSLLLTVLLLVPLSLPAFAQGTGGEPQLIVSTEQAMPGDEVSVSITIQNNPGIGVINPKFVFDSSRLQWLGYEEGGLKGWTVTEKAGVWLGNSDSVFNGVILTLRFKVLDTAQEGLAEISLICSDGDAYNYAEELILFQLISGGVRIGSNVPSPSPSPAAENGGGGASPTAAPLPSPAAESSAPNDKESEASPTAGPAAAKEDGASSAEQPAVSEDRAEPQPLPEPEAAEEGLPKTQGVSLLPVALAGCAILALVVILLRKSRRGK